MLTVSCLPSDVPQLEGRQLTQAFNSSLLDVRCWLDWLRHRPLSRFGHLCPAGGFGAQWSAPLDRVVDAINPAA